MKSFTRSNLIAVLVLGALGAPLSAYAASSAKVEIIATVTEKFSVAVDKAVVNFNDGGNSDVTITTTSNAAKHTAGAILTITSNVNASGKTMRLQHVDTKITETYPVNVKVGSADADFSDTTKKTTHKVVAPGEGKIQKTTMSLTSDRAEQTLPAGEYKGTLTIVVSPA